jgi:serine/threonine protein kinase
MHRDLKPSNIMIRDYEYLEEFDPDVVVLDFDMSWHKGSKEKDVVFESRDDFGYLAPEQTVSHGPYHPRNTKVDSYGLGMTAYALYGSQAPLANESLNPDWFEKVLTACQKRYDHGWKSAPYRLARSIRDATTVDQSERKDFFRLTRQFDVVLRAIQSTSELNEADAWAEELLARLGSSLRYEWDDERSGGYLASPGVNVFADGDVINRRIDIKMEYIDQGMQKRSNIKFMLQQNLDKAVRELRAGGWRIGVANVMMSSSVVTANATVDEFKDSNVLFTTAKAAFGSLKA